MTLIDAVIANNLEAVRELLFKGVDPTGTEDIDFISLLHFAAQHNAVDVARLLIAAGAAPNAKTIDGVTPLEIAKLHKHHEMIELLTSAISQISC